MAQIGGGHIFGQRFHSRRGTNIIIIIIILENPTRISCLNILKFQINEETDFVELHSVDLDLENIIYTPTTPHTCESIEFASIKPFAESEIARIFFKEKLAKGAGILSLDFKGTYPEDEGLYRTACLFRNGKSEFGVCTQFQVDL